MNKVGVSIEPCGAPNRIISKRLEMPLTDTFCFQLWINLWVFPDENVLNARGNYFMHFFTLYPVIISTSFQRCVKLTWNRGVVVKLIWNRDVVVKLIWNRDFSFIKSQDTEDLVFQRCDIEWLVPHICSGTIGDSWEWAQNLVKMQVIWPATSLETKSFAGSTYLLSITFWVEPI